MKNTSTGAEAVLQPTLTPEVIFVDSHADEVKCDGGGGALGHPTVWYSLDGQNQTECLYCDRVFVKQT